ncbi:MAG: hypothetical protein ACR2QJ_11325 [Geminicoccaceae bacterium]
MGIENAISWKEIAAQYNLWARKADLAAILASHPFGEIPLARLTPTFGKQSLFLDEKAGMAGLYLGSFSIVFDLVAERRSLSNPTVIRLPEVLTEAPAGLRDLYLATGENFVGHHLGGRLSTIISHPEEAEEIVFIFERETEAVTEPPVSSADTDMFRQIWRALRSASVGSRHADGEPGGGKGGLGAGGAAGKGAPKALGTRKAVPWPKSVARDQAMLLPRIHIERSFQKTAHFYRRTADGEPELARFSHHCPIA